MMIKTFKKKPEAFINIDIENGRIETRLNMHMLADVAEALGFYMGQKLPQDHPAARAFLRGLIDGWSERYGEPSEDDAKNKLIDALADIAKSVIEHDEKIMPIDQSVAEKKAIVKRAKDILANLEEDVCVNEHMCHLQRQKANTQTKVLQRGVRQAGQKAVEGREPH